MLEDYEGLYCDFDDNQIKGTNVFYSLVPRHYTVENVMTKNTCIVCLGSNDKWNSIILPCLHTAHTRCYRAFVNEKKNIVCPVCNEIDWS